MSTNKTQNYQLHAWAPEDEESLAELNANFTKLDAALKAEETTRISSLAGALQARARVVVGTYVGTGEALHIELGARPLAVLLEHIDGIRSNDSRYINGGMLFSGVTTLKGCAHVDDTGFTLNGTVESSNHGYYVNPKGATMLYWAVLPGV